MSTDYVLMQKGGDYDVDFIGNNIIIICNMRIFDYHIFVCYISDCDSRFCIFLYFLTVYAIFHARSIAYYNYCEPCGWNFGELWYIFFTFYKRIILENAEKVNTRDVFIPLSKRKLTDPCRCGSGKSFIECHGKTKRN